MPQNLASRSRAEARLRLPVRQRLLALSKRLLHADNLLRGGVPLLMILFITSLGAAIFIRLVQEREEILSEARLDMQLSSAGLAAELKRELAQTTPYRAMEKLLAGVQDAAARRKISKDRVFLAIDTKAVITASSSPATFPLNHSLLEHLEAAAPLLDLDEGVGILDIQAGNGSRILAASHRLSAPLGMLIELQPTASLLAPWRHQAVVSVSTFAVTSFVVLLLGFAFHWQAVRAQEADLVSLRTRARLDLALDRGRCGLWDWDLRRGEVYWSASMFDMLGRSPREDALSPAEIAGFTHAEDHDFINGIASGRLPRGDIEREIRMIHANGAYVWIRVRAEITLLPGDNDPHLLGAALDITKKRALTEERNRSDQRLRAALDSINEAFVLWDADNRLVLCNTQFQLLHGLPDHALVAGTTYEQVISAGRRPLLIRAAHFEAAPTGQAEDHPSAGERPECGDPIIPHFSRPPNKPASAQDGHSYEALLEDGRWLLVSERRTRDGGFVSVGADITARKQHEERLVLSDRRLRQMVEDLTQSRQALELQAVELSELAEKYARAKHRAEKAKRKAETANRAKSEFLANISHELRTPLNAILGFSQVMQSAIFGPLGSERYLDYCRDINRSGQHLLDVINDILDIAKLEAGRQSITCEELDLREIVSQTLSMLDTQAATAGVTLSSVMPAEAVVRGDQRAIKQILLNLLSNALKFTPAHGAVEVSLANGDEHVDIAIRDTGIGIPEAMIQQLGQPFVQVENQYTKRHKGSGLGLSISRSLVALHGGGLTIQSAPEEGTTVTVRLPRHIRETAGASACV